MFERFTEDARQLVVEAQAQARALGHGWIGTEHLLLAAAGPDSSLRPTLDVLGLTQQALHDEVTRVLGRLATADPSSDHDADALRCIGIDIDAVRRRVEDQFGPGALDAPAPAPTRRLRRLRSRARSIGRDPHRGHIPFTRKAKKALVLALREAVGLHSGEIASGHVLLGILGTDGLAVTVVVTLGVEPDDLRAVVLDQLRRAA